MSEEGKPSSAPCYHGEHQNCPIPEHCGCRCHTLIPIEDAPDAPVTSQEIQNLRQEVAELAAENDYYRNRLLTEMDVNHKIAKELEIFKARAAAAIRKGAGEQSG